MAEAAERKVQQRRAQRSREMSHKYARNLSASDGAIVVVTHSSGGGQRTGRVRRTVSGRPHADFAVGVRDAVATTPALDILYSVVFKKTRREVRADLARRQKPMTKAEADVHAARKIAHRLGKLTVEELIDYAIAYGQHGVALASVPVPDTDPDAVPEVRGQAEVDEEEDADFGMDCASAAAGAVQLARR